MSNVIPLPAYTASDMARILNVPRRTVYRWLGTGVIPATKYAGRWTITQRRFASWLKSCEHWPDEPDQERGAR